MAMGGRKVARHVCIEAVVLFYGTARSKVKVKVKVKVKSRSSDL